jgi:polyphosphate glucokinase
LYVDGRLAPNLELARHPFEKGKTYEQRLGDAALDRAGKKRWRERVARMVLLLDRVFNTDLLHIGGGNARKLRAADLPGSVRVFDNVEGMTGGVRLWQVE